MMIRGNRMRFHIIGGGASGSLTKPAAKLAALIMFVGLTALVIFMSICGLAGPQMLGAQAAPANDASPSSSSDSYLGQARKLLDSGTHQSTKSSSGNLNVRQAYQQQQQQLQPNILVPSSSSTDRDPQLEQQLRQSIKLATDLINNYRHNGLSSLPNLPNIPGVNTVMRVPDKMLRAELSMIQDMIRMAMEMMNNPLVAMMNAPREIASMSYRMAEQLEQ